MAIAKWGFFSYFSFESTYSLALLTWVSLGIFTLETDLTLSILAHAAVSCFSIGVATNFSLSLLVMCNPPLNTVIVLHLYFMKNLFFNHIVLLET